MEHIGSHLILLVRICNHSLTLSISQMPLNHNFTLKYLNHLSRAWQLTSLHGSLLIFLLLAGVADDDDDASEGEQEKSPSAADDFPAVV
jgi:hypothetical protein